MFCNSTDFIFLRPIVCWTPSVCAVSISTSLNGPDIMLPTGPIQVLCHVFINRAKYRYIMISVQHGGTIAVRISTHQQQRSKRVTHLPIYVQRSLFDGSRFIPLKDRQMKYTQGFVVLPCCDHIRSWLWFRITDLRIFFRVAVLALFDSRVISPVK